MLHFVFLLTLFLVPANNFGTVKDTCDIDEPDYKGYIMPLEAYHKGKYDSCSIFYRPSKLEVFKAEKFLKIYLDSFCQKVGVWDPASTKQFDDGDIDSYDCLVVKNLFNKYYRQYAACIQQKSNHKYMYINCISPDIKGGPDDFKKIWDFRVADGGPIYFHVEVDLNTGRVLFYDNGWG